MAEEDERCLCHRISKWQNIHHLKVFVYTEHWTLNISNVRTWNFSFTFEFCGIKKKEKTAHFFWFYFEWGRSLGATVCVYTFCVHEQIKNEATTKGRRKKANSKENKSGDHLYWNVKMMVPISTDGCIMAIKEKRHNNNNHCVLLIEFNRFVHLNLWHYYYYNLLFEIMCVVVCVGRYILSVCCCLSYVWYPLD